MGVKVVANEGIYHQPQIRLELIATQQRHISLCYKHAGPYWNTEAHTHYHIRHLQQQQQQQQQQQNQ